MTRAERGDGRRDLAHGAGRPLHVLVAGTAFGRVYLDAVRRDPEAFVLTSILAKGAPVDSTPMYLDTDEEAYESIFVPNLGLETAPTVFGPDVTAGRPGRRRGRGR